ncbi:hypothetical protein SBV1_270013 [Verrucomicrobia bacterium]|nr:hypothetical protein SBV1_270013 [Verrucomicrobiota bacterium]
MRRGNELGSAITASPDRAEQFRPAEGMLFPTTSPSAAKMTDRSNPVPREGATRRGEPGLLRSSELKNQRLLNETHLTFIPQHQLAFAGPLDRAVALSEPAGDRRRLWHQPRLG